MMEPLALLSRFDFLLLDYRVISADRHPTPWAVVYFCPVLTADGKLDCAPK
jgi:hypothetical protein